MNARFHAVHVAESLYTEAIVYFLRGCQAQTITGGCHQDSGCVQNVSTNFYFPQLSPRLAGPEKSI